ncbi:MULTISPECIES: fimbrial protein [unclassified Serratia (in: enterobacteria)]|uniref:fimbrial protein n=1 Tax=unclassified Serratia (in: enterobacteria) TaxID=2647522 RepID=UPI0006923D2A|nr:MULTISPECIES: fimbrial protein [unclassified Serratia (in: enterobacteria)]
MFAQCIKMIVVALVWCYSPFSMAIIAPGSCNVASVTSSPYTLEPLPAKLTNGTILAWRIITYNFTYSKTGSTSDILLADAWYTSGVTGETTQPMFPDEGVGVSLLVLATPGGYANTDAFRGLSTQSVGNPGNNLTYQVFLQQFLVVNDVNRYKGGALSGYPKGLTIAFGNQKTWDDKTVLAGGTRCVASTALFGKEVLTFGTTGELPTLPVPKTPTCDLGGTNITVPLQGVESSAFKKSGDLSGSKLFSIPLGNCGKDAKPYITFTDSNNKANRSNILGLSPGSTATGVGIVLEKSDGQRVQFGAQNTSVSGSNVGQFMIGTSAVEGGSLLLDITAKYIRTDEELKAGEVKAEAIFTLAYP